MIDHRHVYYVTLIYIIILIKNRKDRLLLILILMIVFDMLPFNDSIFFGTVAVNDLTHPKKTLYDKSLTFVHPPYSVSRSKNDFDYL